MAVGMACSTRICKTNAGKKQDRQTNAAPVYNPKSPVRILGVGVLMDDEKRSLSAEERKKL